MTMAADVSRWAALAAAGALVVAGSALGLAAPAQAHNYLVASSPAEGETLTELPETFFVTTNEDLLAINGTAGFAFQIVDAAGLHYETGCVDIDGATMSMEPRIGPAGDYVADWQVVSADGHTVSASIAFTWDPADPSEVSAGSPTAPACGDQLPETAGPTATASAPPATTAPAPGQESEPGQEPYSVPLTDVLWIGGAVLAVGVAIAATILILGRRRG